MTFSTPVCAILISFVTGMAFAREPLPITGPTVFDPKAYGAAGDGVTDDTAAFADAIGAAATVRGIVDIPAGTYVSTMAITKRGITIEGEGKDVTIIKAPNTTAASAAGRVVVVANSNGTTIRDLIIDGNKKARSGKGANRLRVAVVSEQRLQSRKFESDRCGANWYWHIGQQENNDF